MTGIHESLEPVLIEEYSDKFELIVVEIKIQGKEVRIINGYGPQENWTNEEKMPFFVALEEEVSKARLEGKSIILELDANSKLGTKYIRNDPHTISPNGIILSGIIDRHALIVANGLTHKSSGVITRKRSTVVRTEESVIDFVCISSDMQESLVSIQIDENRNHVLTSFTKSKNGPKRHESDHNSILTQFNLEWKEKAPQSKIEVFNFNDKEGQKRFKEMTSNNTKLSSIFESNKDINKQTKQFIKKLDGVLHQCFKKIKIKGTPNKEIDDLFAQQKQLKSKVDAESKRKLKEIEDKLAEKMSEDMFKIVTEEVSKIYCESGGFNSGHLWKLKNKLRPKFNDNPTAVLDINGTLVTSVENIKKIHVAHFQKVLENRTIKSGLEEHKKTREELCEMRIKKAKLNKTPDW